MKVFFLITFLGVWSGAQASEVKTNCPAMNQNREKNLKLAKLTVHKQPSHSKQQ
ncbi:MAG TPA: hypothetical protein VNJ01_12460 [Bacteriovoracaceae bacterium]|nr:hypothetical protein [Bacteriovoracaceae bacterium]